MDCVLAASSAVVRNTRGPQTAGLECPRPGTGAFQATFSAGPHLVGTASGLVPSPRGPRHHGQSPAAAAGAGGSTSAGAEPAPAGTRRAAIRAADRWAGR